MSSISLRSCNSIGFMQIWIISNYLLNLYQICEAMISGKYLKILFLLIICIYFSCCKTEQFFLNGGLTGTVADSLTGLPVSGASAILYPLNDSATTDNNGKFHFGNLEPGTYEVKVEKAFSYFGATKDTIVSEGETPVLNFSLNGIPSPYFSTSYLDFGFDSTVKQFTISNKGEGILKFSIKPDYFFIEDWITIEPSSGEISKGIASVTVTINRDLIPPDVKQEYVWINISDQYRKNYNIPVLVNGVLDTRDLRHYSIVKIGLQTWLSQSLNAGSFTDTSYNQLNNVITERYCYDNIKFACDWTGGLYTWSEMMGYAPSDNNENGTIQGICPDGWHIPTYKEWGTLIDYLGGESIAGGKLKDPTGPPWNSWEFPNTGATNETGFTAYGGGYFDKSIKTFLNSFYDAYFSTATEVSADSSYVVKLKYDSSGIEFGTISKSNALSVRCIKNK
jgi:uncharacterized protein (TIGR02145 family)